jgi:hypothetical protein
MRKIVGIAALMLAICCPTLAGEIPNPPAPQPQANTVQEPTTDGDIQNDVTESLTRIALDLLAVLPSLL